VTKNHRYKNDIEDLMGVNETYDEPSLKSANEEEQIFLKYNVLTHKNKKQEIFSRKFL